MASMFVSYLVLLIQFRQAGPSVTIEETANNTFLQALGNITGQWGSDDTHNIHHCSDVTMIPRRLKSPATRLLCNRLFTYIKQKHLSPRYWLFVSIPLTKGQLRGNRFHSMMSLCAKGAQFLLLIWRRSCQMMDDENHHDDVIKRKHFPRHWPFVRGVHRSSVNSLRKGQWCGALMFSLIFAWTHG